MQADLAHIRRVLNSYTPQTLAHTPGEDMNPSAVIFPLLIKDDDIHLLFTKRTQTLSQHKGEMSFPGGRLEPQDENLLACALRETEEEIGVPKNAIEVIGQLDETPVITSYRITPYVGIIPYPFDFVLSEAEIDQLLITPLTRFFDDALHRIKINDWMGYKVPIHFFEIDGQIIWGATGRIVANFLRVCCDYIPSEYQEFLEKYKDPLVKLNPN